MKRIKVKNETNHGHSVRMLLDNGNYTYRRLAKKGNFVALTEDQFIDLFTTSRDFKSGYLSFEMDDLSDEVRQAIGLPLRDEEVDASAEEEFKIYTDEEILSIIKSKGNKFKNFCAEIEKLNAKQGDELRRRIFNVAETIEGLSRTKSEAIEDLTGKSFRHFDKLKKETEK